MGCGKLGFVRWCWQDRLVTVTGETCGRGWLLFLQASWVCAYKGWLIVGAS